MDLESVVVPTGEIMDADEGPTGRVADCSNLALTLDFDLDLTSDPDSRYVLAAFLDLGCNPPGFVLLVVWIGSLGI